MNDQTVVVLFFLSLGIAGYLCFHLAKWLTKQKSPSYQDRKDRDHYFKISFIDKADNTTPPRTPMNQVIEQHVWQCTPGGNRYELVGVVGPGIDSLKIPNAPLNPRAIITVPGAQPASEIKCAYCDNPITEDIQAKTCSGCGARLPARLAREARVLRPGRSAYTTFF